MSLYVVTHSLKSSQKDQFVQFNDFVMYVTWQPRVVCYYLLVIGRIMRQKL